MKGSDNFKKAIERYLQKVATVDPLFAKTLEKENKNIDDCITYILNTVQKSGSNGFADTEVYAMAIHYYDEDTIEVGKANEGKVIVNHHVEITEEEIAEAKQKAIEEIIQAEKAKLQKKKVVTPTVGAIAPIPTDKLF